MKIGSPRRMMQACGCGIIWLACCCGAFHTLAEVLAAEVRLRAECRTAAAVVRLGDVADISSAAPGEASALAQLELFAAPPAGRSRHVTARDIHEALVLAGYDLRKIRLSGAANICVSAAERQPMQRTSPSSSEASLGRGQKLIEQAVRGALEVQFGVGSWGLEWDRPNSVFAAAARPGAAVEVLRIALLDAGQTGEDYDAVMSETVVPAAEKPANDGLEQDGRHSPGRQTRQPSAARNAQAKQSMEFGVQLRITVGEEESTHDLHVRATRRPQVVVARRTLAPGTVITTADIEIAEARPTHPSEPAVEGGLGTAAMTQAAGSRGAAVHAAPLSWDECLGMETTRTIAARQVLTADALREPTLVKRGEAVTVYARSRGVMVRVTGRALESGSRGSLISIESLENRQRFLARVCGVQQVVVEAEPQPAESDSEEPGRLAEKPHLGAEEALAPTGDSSTPRQVAADADRRLPRSYRARRPTAEENGP